MRIFNRLWTGLGSKAADGQHIALRRAPHASASRLPQLDSDIVRRRSAKATRVVREVLWKERKRLEGGTTPC